MTDSRIVYHRTDIEGVYVAELDGRNIGQVYKVGSQWGARSHRVGKSLDLHLTRNDAGTWCEQVCNCPASETPKKPLAARLQARRAAKLAQGTP